jgi:hypothetical protein
MRFRQLLVLGMVVGGFGLAVGSGDVAASTPAPPINDNYLASLELNGPGRPLNDTDTLEDIRDTTNATVQTNIFSPCQTASCPSGPPEVTNCKGVTYGKTIWYDFYPNKNGAVDIRTSGFPNVIAVYPFSLRTALPNINQSNCQASVNFPSNELSMKVTKGVAYTIQLGGVNDAGGLLQFKFDFFAAAPHRLSAQTTLTAKQTSNGIQIVNLVVQSSRSAKVTVTCGRFCASESKTKEASEKFPGLNGVRMPAGSDLKIYVTAPGSIGAYIQYAILPGNFTKLTRCLEPGKRTPRRSCH